MGKPKSTLAHLLIALLPYSRANAQLTYKPERFFKQLEEITGSNRHSLQSTLSRAQKQGLIARDSNATPRLTIKGRERARLYQPKPLKKDVYLMVIFDIPEQFARRRQSLRYYLKKLSFHQIQRSVWVTRYDYQHEIRELVQYLDVGQFVQVFESIQIYISFEA